MFGLGAQELIVILLIGLVLFGGAKIPELGRSLGQAIREFKKGAEESEAKSKEGVATFTEVRYAILEEDGHVTVIPRRATVA